MAFEPPPPQPMALILAGAVENIDFDILSKTSCYFKNTKC
jgi:hypothetical protein